jgi:dTDP-4-dehydrorhamnose 3,5-epimerase-like enzyme
MEPKLIKGGIAIDDRGAVSFVNDFNFQGVKRFYTIENHKQGFIRAWHGHKKEGKYFLVVKGSAIICGVEIDDWENPSKNLKIFRYVLSEVSPSVLYMPAGYANGSMTLSKDSKIMVFSDSTLEESLHDDIRFDSRHWNPWEVIER